MRIHALALAALASILVAGCAVDGTEEEADDANAEPASSEGALRVTGFVEPRLSATERANVLAKYDNVDDGGVIPKKLLEDALVFFDANKSKITNKNYLTVVDFSKHSGKKRFFLIDMRTGSVQSHVVAHGSGSDADNNGTAEKFSNLSGSNASSLGYYLTAEIYSGKHGRSMRLDGLSDTNYRARDRAVVVHTASYVKEGNSKQGRSWGCLVLDEDVKDAIVDKIKGGSVIYAGLSSS
ncbi:MAG: murein L,D-transpeptidase catalytic domain family protein [Myxococcales bacterium]|jgi:hypothetical protein|nr:murein L,D-transpeptidase catalytic domain family protein [Myxococcales bacterium]